MADWIPFEEGSYRLVQTYLVSAGDAALEIASAFVNVFKGPQGQLLMNGRAQVRPLLVVQLLEESDQLDLLLDFGGEFKYLMESPELKAGKVFSPAVTSTMQFFPVKAWQPLSIDQFNRRVTRLKLIN